MGFEAVYTGETTTTSAPDHHRLYGERMAVNLSAADLANHLVDALWLWPCMGQYKNHHVRHKRQAT